MLKRFKGAAIAVSALAILSTAAYAAGLFPGLPIVGSAAYCQGYSNYSTSVTTPGTLPTPNACNSTAPAGPSIVTGSELIPADTELANGVPPQTVYVPMASLNALPITVATVITGATGNTLVAAATSGGYILHSTASVTSVVLSLPAAPIDGQQFAVSADQLITSLTVTSPTAGVTVTKTPSILTPSTTGTFGYRFLYNAASTNWYRLG
jgi:hypothetical protein